MILIPLPTYGFDPTEAAVPWRYLSDQKVDIVFATPDGRPAAADDRLLTGKGFGIFKKMLMASQEAREDYESMLHSKAFQHPIAYSQIDVTDFDGLVLPGGHDKGMRSYLEATDLQAKVVSFFQKQKPVGAICHGTIVAARSIDRETGRSVLYEHRTTALTKVQELGAFLLTSLWLGDYYRTYPETVEHEVRSVLKVPNSQFEHGPLTTKRDTLDHLDAGFVVVDGAYVSARWPGDAHRFAKAFYTLLKKEN